MFLHPWCNFLLMAGDYWEERHRGQDEANVEKAEKKVYQNLSENGEGSGAGLRGEATSDRVRGWAGGSQRQCPWGDMGSTEKNWKIYKIYFLGTEGNGNPFG